MSKYKHTKQIEEFRKKFGLTSEAMKSTYPNIWKDGLKDIEQFLDEQLTKKGEEVKMKLYIWRDIRCDYTCGIGFAMARNIEEAREAIKNVSEDWEWDVYKGEIMGEPEIYEIPTGAWISGGG